MKKLYYTVHLNYYCRQLNIYEIVDNEPKEFHIVETETWDEDDCKNIAKSLSEEKELAESEYELKEL